jgi:hypothetical protein
MTYSEPEAYAAAHPSEFVMPTSSIKVAIAVSSTV